MTGQLNTFRRVGDSITRILNEEARFPRYRDHAPWEIRAFQDEIAATGADIGGGPYPVRRSVAFRGPEAALDRPWHNGMFIDEAEPRRPQVPYMERNNYYWGYYYRNRNVRRRQAAQRSQQQRPVHYNQNYQQHHHPNHQRQSVYSRQNRQQVLYHEERAHREEQQEQPEQPEQSRVPTPPPRPTAAQLQEQQTREEARRTALAMITWDNDLPEEATLVCPDIELQRMPTASADSSQEQQQPRGLVPDELTPQWVYVPSEEGGCVEEASLDEDQDYVTSEGHPIRKRTPEQREAARAARVERRAVLARMYRQQQRDNRSTLVQVNP